MLLRGKNTFTAIYHIFILKTSKCRREQEGLSWLMVTIHCLETLDQQQQQVPSWPQVGTTAQSYSTAASSACSFTAAHSYGSCHHRRVPGLQQLRRLTVRGIRGSSQAGRTQASALDVGLPVQCYPVADCNYQKWLPQYFHLTYFPRTLPLCIKVKSVFLPFALGNIMVCQHRECGESGIVRLLKLSQNRQQSFCLAPLALSLLYALPWNTTVML